MRKISISFMAKTLAFALIFIMGAISFVTPASAIEDNGIAPQSHIFMVRSYMGNFAKAWEKTASENVLLGTGERLPMSITYGYNTFLINEDYCWADCDEAPHWASLHNGKGEHSALLALPGFTSKIEVTHNGTSISYYCNVD